MPSPGLQLRRAWDERTLAVPGVFDALVARLAERLGFSAIYLSGAALSASAGLPDVGLLSVTEFVDRARTITQATSLPLLCDADTGFGEVLNVERTVRLFESAGVAGIHLEDQELPKRCGHLSGKRLVEPDAMAAKIRAAVAARRDSDFVVIARTDARSVTGFDDAVRRGRVYLAKGASASAGQYDGIRAKSYSRLQRFDQHGLSLDSVSGFRLSLRLKGRPAYPGGHQETGPPTRPTSSNADSSRALRFVAI